MNRPRQPSFEVRVPASTANLGAGFDCFGLALELFLKVRATVLSGTGKRLSVRSHGARGSAQLAQVPEQNLIFRALQDTAKREGFTVPPVRLDVYNDIPVAGGLGSSAAAIVAGMGLGFALAGRKVSLEVALRLGFELEGHADNAAAALLGGLVVTAARSDGSIVALRRRWPREIRIVAVTPELSVETKRARAVLPENVDREAAVRNLQRSALLIAALAEKRFDLLWEALQDSLHQDCRCALIPGLREILRMPRAPGLLGLALSGSGPSVVALATDHFAEIGKSIEEQFARQHLASTVRCLAVSETGLTIGDAGRRGRN